MKDFVNKVLSELKDDSELNNNALVKMVLESANKSIVNNDSYDNIYVQLKGSLIGVNEHLKNNRIRSMIAQFNKNERTDDSVLHEMSKLGKLTDQLDIIKESNAYTNPIIKSKVDNYDTQLKNGSPEFQLYPSFISELSSHLHESTVNKAVNHISNVMKNKASDFEVLNTITLMQQTDGECTIDSKKPTVLVGKQAVYDQYFALLQPHQRLVSEEMKNLGFDGVITFSGKPFIVDSHCPAGEIQFINENHLYLCVHKDDNMKITSFDKLETFDGILNRITWMGNLICDARRLQGKLDDILTA